MKHTPAVPVLVAVPGDPGEERFLADVVGNAVAVAEWVVEEGLFTSKLPVQLSESFREGQLGRERLTCHIPDAPSQQLSKLDPRGIIRSGSEVGVGDPLVGKRVPNDNKGFTAADMLFHSIFGEPATHERDASLYWEALDPGQVISARLLARRRYQCSHCGDVGLYEKGTTCPYCGGRLTGRTKDNLPQGMAIQVEVEAVIRRPLRVGDVLVDDQGCRAVVARIVRRSEVPAGMGKRVAIWAHPDSPLSARLPRKGKHHPRQGEIPLRKATLRQEDKLVARGCGGAYGLISHTPLIIRDSFRSAQKLERKTVHALLRAGFRHNLAEMLTIKSDAIAGRLQAYEALVKGEDVAIAFPESGNRLIQMLRALGLVAVLRTADGDELALDQATRAEDLSLQVRLANSRDVRSWSFGEVKKPETLNYRTYRPEKDGLFCERIFGPERDWECACGKYRGMKHKGTVCDRCGVTVLSSGVRRERMGHVELAVPVVHTWFLRHEPGLAALLGLDQESLNQTAYHQRRAVTDPGSTELSAGQLLTEEEYERARARHGADSFRADVGADAIRKLLRRLCPGREEGLVFDALPVLPPDWRPLVLLDDGNFATSDLNDLYRRVINQNNRLKKLIELDAPPAILCNEKALLQRSVDGLFDNGNSDRPVLGSNKRALKSLSEILTSNVTDLDEKSVEYCAEVWWSLIQTSARTWPSGCPRWWPENSFRRWRSRSSRKREPRTRSEPRKSCWRLSRHHRKRGRRWRQPWPAGRSWSWPRMVRRPCCGLGWWRAKPSGSIPTMLGSLESPLPASR